MKKDHGFLSEILTIDMNGDAYRKGYREGWLAAIHRMRELIDVKRLSFREAYERCYAYRKRLHEWTLHRPTSTASLAPPEFDE